MTRSYLVFVAFTFVALFLFSSFDPLLHPYIASAYLVHALSAIVGFILMCLPSRLVVNATVRVD